MKTSHVSVVFNNPSLRGLIDIRDVEQIMFSIIEEDDSIDYSIKITSLTLSVGGNIFSLQPQYPDSLYKMSIGRNDLKFIYN